MGFKTGLLVGFGAGYVLGSKAGRERYEEIRATWNQVMGNPRVQRTIDKSRDVVETGTQRGLQAVQEGVDRAAEGMNDRLKGSSTT